MKFKCIQTFSKEYLKQCQAMTADGILQFLDDFSKLHSADLNPAFTEHHKVNLDVADSKEHHKVNLDVADSTPVKLSNKTTNRIFLLNCFLD